MVFVPVLDGWPLWGFTNVKDGENKKDGLVESLGGFL